MVALLTGAIGLVSGLTGSASFAGAEPPEARRFIVTLRNSAGDPAAVAAEHAARYGAAVDFVYRHALKGYAAKFHGTGASEVTGDSRVARVEPDGVATASVTQNNATWGLDRIDQRALPLSTTFTYGSTGAGVTAYIIDTGIRFDHSEFAGRATPGFDAFTTPAANGDCNGHGTHVAGTVGGAAHGVAKDVSLVAVRVLDCAGSGSWSGVIAGIDWVIGHHEASEPDSVAPPAVANMSLGGGANSSVDDAVRSMIRDGVSTAVAAGNGNIAGVHQDACKSSPARVAEAITISATDKADKKASWANYGKCVDWFAPGVGITSAWHTTEEPTKTISGTSMATPHTAGVASLYLQTMTAATPQQVRDALYNATTKGLVTSSKTANNHLLFTR